MSDAPGAAAPAAADPLRPLAGQVALVTGASRGIGRAIALHLASLGAKVAVNYARQADAAAEVVAAIAAQGGQALALGADVADEAAVDAMFGGLEAAWGPVCDVLVNNAGVVKDGLLLRAKAADLDALLATNVRGAFLCAKAASRWMIKRRHGRIVNVSSVVGETGNAGQSAYAASKAALVGFTYALARELASRNVTVNAVAPGYVETDMTAALSEEQRARLLALIPLGRFATAAEVASAVAYLATAGAYVTGQVLRVDGGMAIG